MASRKDLCALAMADCGPMVVCGQRLVPGSPEERRVIRGGIKVVANCPLAANGGTVTEGDIRAAAVVVESMVRFFDGDDADISHRADGDVVVSRKVQVLVDGVRVSGPDTDHGR